MAEVPINGGIWTYKDKTYEVVSVKTKVYAQDKDTGEWGPSIEYMLGPYTRTKPVLMFVRNLEEFTRLFTFTGVIVTN